MLGALAAAVVTSALPAAQGGLPADLLLAAPGHARAPDAIVDQATLVPRQHAPAAVLKESERLTWRPHTAEGTSLPLDLEAWRPRTAEGTSLPLDVEAWHGILCLKGAWTLHASRNSDALLGEDKKEPPWQMQISPALVAGGTRFVPGIGIGASSRF